MILETQEKRESHDTIGGQKAAEQVASAAVRFAPEGPVRRAEMHDGAAPIGATRTKANHFGSQFVKTPSSD